MTDGRIGDIVSDLIAQMAIEGYTPWIRNVDAKRYGNGEGDINECISRVS